MIAQAPEKDLISDNGWLGPLPSSWRQVRLKDVASIRPSTVDKKTYEGQALVGLCNYTDVYYNDVITRDLEFMIGSASSEEIAAFSLRAGQVIVTKDSETADDIGIAAYVPEDVPGVVCGYHLAVVQANPSVASGRFIKCLFDSTYVKSMLATRANGLTRVGLGQSAFSTLPIPLPSIDEQLQIATYLDDETATIDALVAKQERLIALLVERRQSIIDGYFEPSELNRSHRLRNLLTARPTYGVLVPTYVDGGAAVPFIRVGDLATLDAESPSARISAAQSTEYARTRIVGGEVLLGVVGRMGQVAIAPQRLRDANVARAVAVLRCIDRGTAELLASWLTSTMFLDQAGLATSGDSVQPTLGMGDLASMSIRWPKDAEAAAQIVGKLKHEIALIDQLRAKTERFIELSKERRQALISAAVTGRIDVRGLV